MELCGDTVLTFSLIVEHFLKPFAKESIFPTDFNGIFSEYLVATYKLLHLKSPHGVPWVYYSPTSTTVLFCSFVVYLYICLLFRMNHIPDCSTHRIALQCAPLFTGQSSCQYLTLDAYRLLERSNPEGSNLLLLICPL